MPSARTLRGSSLAGIKRIGFKSLHPEECRFPRFYFTTFSKTSLLKLAKCMKVQVVKANR